MLLFAETLSWRHYCRIFELEEIMMETDLKPLEMKEMDVSYAIGLVRHWLETDTNPKAKQVLEHFQEVVTGVNFYRERYITMQQLIVEKQHLYDALMGQSALYLQAIQTKQDTIDQLLAESQREYHKSE